MGELLIYSWASGVLSAWESHNIPMLVLFIGGPVLLFMMAWAASRPQVPASRLNRVWKAQAESLPVATMSDIVETPSVPSEATQDPDEWRPIQGRDILEGFELGEPQPHRIPADERLVQLQLEVHRLRRVVEAFDGDAVARLKGRVYSWRGQSVALVVPNGLLGHQVVFVRVPEDEADRDELPAGILVDLVCRWADGRLVVERVLSVEPCEDPLPEVPELDRPVPSLDIEAAFTKPDRLRRDEHSVSELRTLLTWKVHYRRAVLTVPMLQVARRAVADLADEMGVSVLAFAFENAQTGKLGDHVHMVLDRMSPAVPVSTYVARFKQRLAKLLRAEFPELHEVGPSLWAVGYHAACLGGSNAVEKAVAYTLKDAEVWGLDEQGQEMI